MQDELLIDHFDTLKRRWRAAMIARAGKARVSPTALDAVRPRRCYPGCYPAQSKTVLLRAELADLLAKKRPGSLPRAARTAPAVT